MTVAHPLTRRERLPPWRCVVSRSPVSVRCGARAPSRRERRAPALVRCVCTPAASRSSGCFTALAWPRDPHADPPRLHETVGGSRIPASKTGAASQRSIASPETDAAESEPGRKTTTASRLLCRPVPAHPSRVVRDRRGHAEPARRTSSVRAIARHGSRSLTASPKSFAIRRAINERWQAAASRSTQNNAVAASSGISATMGPRSTLSRTSRS
jgi:hypothetical protein